MSASLHDIAVEQHHRTFAAPSRYQQGPGLFDEIGCIVAELGRRPVVIIDSDITDLLGSRLTASMSAAGLNHQVVACHGMVTAQHIAETTARVVAGGDLVVGIGGGKALDTAKGVAQQLGVAMISVPTVASNDGPTASVFALYDDAGRLSELGRMRANPAVVVVDTELIAGAPIRFLLSGIGDALAKKFEAASCARGRGVTTQGTRPLLIGSVVADGCARVLLRYGRAAVSHVSEGRVTPAVEAVVEAVILLSGIGYENGGLSIAHCMTRGLQVAQGASRHLHGYHVAYGLLVQLALEDDPALDRHEISSFLADVGLPVRLADLDMPDPTSAEISELATAAAAAPHVANTWVEASSERIVAAIECVEREAVAQRD